MDSLGEGYGLEDLRAVLSGKKAHTPRKKTVTDVYKRQGLPMAAIWLLGKVQDLKFAIQDLVYG